MATQKVNDKRIKLLIVLRSETLTHNVLLRNSQIESANPTFVGSSLDLNRRKPIEVGKRNIDIKICEALNSDEQMEVIKDAKEILDVEDVVASILLVDDLGIQKD